MTDYTTAAEVKSYIGTDKAADDALIADLVTRASARIDAYCQRVFVAAAGTRTFDAVQQVDGRTLLLDEDLISITTLTNGDGAAVDAAHVLLLPPNVTPKYAIKLKASSGVSWTYVSDAEQAISVNGTWGYAGTQPADIRHAAIRLAAWFYHQRQAPFETQGMPELGLVTVPADMPPDIKALLDPYVRQTIGAV